MDRMKGGDLIALEAKYHLNGLTVLRNHYRSLVCKHEQEMEGSSEERKVKGNFRTSLLQRFTAESR